ncbi:MAG: hypothetical protein JO251_17710 [Verrucomicrobia bacterium]|nr:hypothetical protein [Verrucomicrobiota bacterium]
MQKPITRTSWHEPDGGVLMDEHREELAPLGFLPEAVEINDQQLERVLNYLGEKLSELDRYVYMIRLCDRNETLFQKVLISERIRFLLSFDCRRRLHEIWLRWRSFEWDAHFEPSEGSSSAAAA